MNVGTLLLILLIALPAQKNNWKKALEKDGITVYTRHTESSNFKEFKGEILIDGTIGKISETIMDVAKFPEWNYRTKEIRVLNKGENRVRFFYISDTPSFLKTRVGCMESVKKTDPESGKVIISMYKTECSEALEKNMMLIPEMKGEWQLIPQSDGRVKVIMQMLFDPGGIIPAWLANMVISETPYISLRNLAEMQKK